MHSRRIGVAAAVVVASTILAACSLTSLFLPPVDYTDPSFTFGPEFSFLLPFESGGAPVALHRGTATITITSGEPRVVELPCLASEQP